MQKEKAFKVDGERVAAAVCRSFCILNSHEQNRRTDSSGAAAELQGGRKMAADLKTSKYMLMMMQSFILIQGFSYLQINFFCSWSPAKV